jgi:hypothetical protein
LKNHTWNSISAAGLSQWFDVLSTRWCVSYIQPSAKQQNTRN